MIKEKKRKRMIAIIIIILLLIIAGCFYFFILKDNSKGRLFNNNNNNNVTFEEIKETEIEKIINNELAILDKKEKISEITNQEKLWFAYLLMTNNEIKDEGFSADALKEAFEKSSISYLGLTNESFSCFAFKDHPYIFIYDKEKNEYTYNTAHGGHGVTKIERVYSKIIEIKDDNKKYVVSVKSLFTKSVEGDIDLNIYGNYDNALNSKESIGTISIENNSLYNAGKTYMDKNYNTIKDELDTYLYYFEKVDGKINLVDYEKK